MSTAANFVSSMFGGGRAAGGPTEKGQFYSTVEHGRPELFMLGGQGHVVGAVETARMIEQMGEGRGGSSRESHAPIVQQTLKFDNRGAVMTSDLLNNMEKMSASAGAFSFSASRKAVPSDMARAGRYSLGRRR